MSDTHPRESCTKCFHPCACDVIAARAAEKIHRWEATVVAQAKRIAELEAELARVRLEKRIAKLEAERAEWQCLCGSQWHYPDCRHAWGWWGLVALDMVAKAREGA